MGAENSTEISNLKNEVSQANASVESLCKEKASYMAQVEELSALHKSTEDKLKQAVEDNTKGKLNDKREKAEIDSLKDILNKLTNENVDLKQKTNTLEEDEKRRKEAFQKR